MVDHSYAYTVLLDLLLGHKGIGKSIELGDIKDGECNSFFKYLLNPSTVSQNSPPDKILSTASGIAFHLQQKTQEDAHP